MRVGVFYFPTDYGIDIAELALALEERGFGSLYVPEHTHIPTGRRTPFFGGGELPKRYSHTHDPFVALSFAAAATKKLLVGTGICLIRSATRSSPRNALRASTNCRAAGSSSASAATGMSRRWRTTARATRRGSE